MGKSREKTLNRPLKAAFVQLVLLIYVKMPFESMKTELILQE